MLINKIEMLILFQIFWKFFKSGETHGELGMANKSLQVSPIWHVFLQGILVSFHSPKNMYVQVVWKL